MSLPKDVLTENHIFLAVVGASGSGKTSLIKQYVCGVYRPLSVERGIFIPQHEQIFYFYQYWQPIYSEMELILGSKLTLVRLENDELNPISSTIAKFQLDTTHLDQWKLFVFDDSCVYLQESDEFVNLATAGRHMRINVIFVKHNIYQQGKHSVTVDKNTTHILITKTSRINKQLRILGSEIGSAAFLEDCYKKATSTKYGHLLIDLTPYCPEWLRFASNTTPSEEDIAAVFWIKESESSNSVLPSDLTPKQQVQLKNLRGMVLKHGENN